MDAIELLYPQAGTPNEGVPSPVDLNGYSIAYRNLGLVPTYLTCDFLIDGTKDVPILPGECRIIRAVDGAWWTTAYFTVFAGARLGRSSSQSIPDSTETAISFDTTRYDTMRMFDLAAPTRLTAPVSGKYSMGGSVNFAAIGPGATLKYIALNVNGIAVAKEDWDAVASQTHILAAEYELVRGDYIELVVWQNSGGALSVATRSNYSPELWAHLLR